MAVRELVRGENGQPQFKVITETMEPAELDQLRSDVAGRQTAEDAQREVVTQIQEQLKEAVSELERRESATADSKSELEALEVMVANPDGQLDDGTAQPSGDVSDAGAGDQETPAFAQLA